MQKYEKDGLLSYTLGLFPTFELLTNCAENVEKLIFSSKLIKTQDVGNLIALAEQKNIPIETNDKLVNKLSPKENCFVIGVFKKFKKPQTKVNKKLVLVNPSDMGNLGTIFRTALGFGFTNISLIKPCADYFNPKVIRASMGAVFSLSVEEFDSFEDFEKQNTLPLYLFMLNGEKNLGEFTTPKENFALVFGNEATGLPRDYTQKGTSVLINHSNKIDSLNLPISAAIAMFEFSKK